MAAVPRMTPCWVAAMLNVGDCETFTSDPSPANALANPKSRTFTWPSGVTLMLAGLRSRWMTPFSCAASRASAICRASFRDSSTGMAPRFSRSASVSPYSRSSSRLRRRKGEKNGKFATVGAGGKYGKSGAFFAELFPSLSCEIRARSLARISTEAAFSTARLIASDLKDSGNLRACVFFEHAPPRYELVSPTVETVSRRISSGTERFGPTSHTQMPSYEDSTIRFAQD